MNICKAALAFALLAATFSSAFAHGGGLDQNGCHHNRKTGGYHCH
ncbi:YHYH domain-containing protein [Sinorhizobium fredii]